MLDISTHPALEAVASTLVLVTGLVAALLLARLFSTLSRFRPVRESLLLS